MYKNDFIKERTNNQEVNVALQVICSASLYGDKIENHPKHRLVSPQALRVAKKIVENAKEVINVAG